MIFVIFVSISTYSVPPQNILYIKREKERGMLIDKCRRDVTVDYNFLIISKVYTLCCDRVTAVEEVLKSFLTVLHIDDLLMGTFTASFSSSTCRSYALVFLPVWVLRLLRHTVFCCSGLLSLVAYVVQICVRCCLVVWSTHDPDQFTV